MSEVSEESWVNRMKELEELVEDEDFEVEQRVENDLYWRCKNCGEENAEYNIAYEEEIICECSECGKKYSAYYCPY